MKIKQFEVWVADLNPRKGTEIGKIRPVVVIQTDLLNTFHPSTLVCPLTTNIQPAATLLRVFVKKGIGRLKNDCDIMIDQIRSIDNRRLQQRLGILPPHLQTEIKENLRIVLDL
ncbi:MAG: type II toxin-antitoxin system PemK/MazF family toxin [Saprospiraceae bacterium]